jgi:hypothetical protein
MLGLDPGANALCETVRRVDLRAAVEAVRRLSPPIGAQIRLPYRPECRAAARRRRERRFETMAESRERAPELAGGRR